jgi:predicted Rossmann-fold nucleotide-binding protein
MTIPSPDPVPVGLLPRIAVIGSGTHPHRERARALGAAVARLGAHVVTGGGGGVMAEVARGFVEVRPRLGLSVGILPAAAPGEGVADSGPGTRPPAGYPNPWVELPILSHLPARGEEGRTPASRNHLVVLTGQIVVALPGSSGTLSEVELALAYGRPVVAHLERRNELPGLPRNVRLVPSLEEVVRLLREAVGR